VPEGFRAFDSKRREQDVAAPVYRAVATGIRSTDRVDLASINSVTTCALSALRREVLGAVDMPVGITERVSAELASLAV
jgi:hypothetical protein